MTETANALPTRRRTRAGVVTTLLLTSIGVIAPIGWEWYASRTALEVRLLQSGTVVGDSLGVEKLRFFYDSTPIGGLTKFELAVVNVGRTALRTGDFVSPVVVTLSGGMLLDVHSTRTDPVGVQFDLRVDKVERSFHFTAPLLNPGDAVFLTALATESSASVATRGRVAGVRVINLRDLRTAGTSLASKVTWGTLVVAAFTAFTILLLAAGLYMNGAQLAIRTLAREQLVLLPPRMTTGELADRLKRGLPPSVAGQATSAIQLLRKFPSSHVLPHDERTALEGHLLGAIGGTHSSTAALWVLFVLASVGTWYVLTQLS